MSRDTSPAVEKFLRERYAKLSGAERLTMGASMFETARALVFASFPPGLTQRELHRRLCERFYGSLADRVYGK